MVWLGPLILLAPGSTVSTVTELKVESSFTFAVACMGLICAKGDAFLAQIMPLTYVLSRMSSSNTRLG